MSNRIQLEGGDKTYIGEVLEIKKKEVWSNLKIELSGSVEEQSDILNEQIKGERVMLILPTRHLENIQYLDKIVFSSAFTRVTNKNNPGEFNATAYFLSKGILYSGFLSSDSIVKVNKKPGVNFLSQLNEVAKWSTSVIRKYVGEEEAAVVIGMLLGDQSSIDWEVKQAFINTGSSHMLAVSGAHIAVITALLIGIIERLGWNSKGFSAALFLLLFLWSYALLTGLSASVLRSVLMFSILIVVRFAYRPADNVQVLCISALLITAFNWNSALDIGFQLSYAAMLGIFLVQPILLKWYMPRNKLFQWLWEGTALCLAAQVFTTPLALYHFHQFPNYFILSNFMVMLASAPLLIGGMLLLLFSWSTWLSICIGWGITWIANGFIAALKAIDKMPFSVAYGYQLNAFALLLAVLLLLFILYHRNGRLKVICIVLFFAVISYQRWINFDKSGVIFFNSNGMVFALKEKSEAILFTWENDKAVRNGERLMNDFIKEFPCTYHIQLLPKVGEEIQVGTDFSVLGFEGFYEMNYRFTSYHLVYNPQKYLEQSTRLSPDEIISMEKVETIFGAHSTSEKSFWLDQSNRSKPGV